jgi:hypothetical protein
MNPNTTISLIVLTLAASISTASAQTLVWSDNFDDNNPLGWIMGTSGAMNETGQQLVVSGSLGPFQPANALATHMAAYHAIPVSGPLPDHQTLEMRADLVVADPNGAWAGLHFLWLLPQAHGYVFFKDEDRVSLIKFWNNASAYAWFFDETIQLKNENVVLALALTRDGANLKINTRVLDKENANAVLIDYTVTDTTEADPVVFPSGWPAVSDFVGTPWPVTAPPSDVELTLQWSGPQATFAQVIYDNLEVWQYESPQLTIHNAVVLSWPLTQGPFVLETADNVDGPWTPMPNPWCRTNAGCTEASVAAPDSLKFFRLRFAP